MIKIQQILLTFLFLCSFSCADKFINDIDIKVPQEELQLVINLELCGGEVTAPETFVARTANIDEVVSTFFTDAIVELYKEEDLLSVLEYIENENVYRSSTVEQLTPGNYTIEVSGVEGFEDIKATQTIPEKVDILEGTYQENGTIEQYYTYAVPVDEVTIKIDDPINEENYYHINLFGVIDKNDGSFPRESLFYPSSLDPFAETSFYHSGILLRDDAFNGEEYNLSIGFKNFFNYNIPNEGESRYIIAELSNVTRDYYLYTRSLAAQLSSVDNPFAEPVIVHNNVENGIGIFSAKNSTRFRIDFE